MLTPPYKPHHLALAFVLVALAGAAPQRQAKAETPMQGDTARGKILTDARGMTLYTYDLDSNGKSNCFANCIETWPPAVASAMDQPSGNFTIIARGPERQWAYKGKPLYYWQDDKKPGDILGDRVNQVWKLARP